METIEVYLIPGLQIYVGNLFADQVRANKAVLLGKLPVTERLLKEQKKKWWTLSSL